MRLREQLAVNVAGFFASEKGIGEGARSTLRSLDVAGVRYLLNNVRDAGSENPDASYDGFSDLNPEKVNLLHVGADIFEQFVKAKSPNYFDGHYNIAYWAWELSEFPAAWESNFNHIDEVWTPSAFSQDAISKVSPVPVIRMPHSLPAAQSAGSLSRLDFGIDPDAFVFLYIFDFHSYSARKNPLGAVSAFVNAFSGYNGVQLVLKGSHEASDPQMVEALKTAARGANVKFINEVYSRDRLNGLLQCCDCYVSLHRSEGFGLTIAEAMSLAKPVIATAFSGNMDFMTPFNSYPVRYRLTEIEQDIGQYMRGATWADPEIDHAAEQMRSVFVDQQSAKARGNQAKRDVSQFLSPGTIGRMMQARLSRCFQLAMPPRPAAESEPIRQSRWVENGELEQLAKAIGGLKIGRRKYL